MLKHLYHRLTHLTLVMVTSLPLLLLLVAILLSCWCVGPTHQSIGYFESYGWPTYGIVKPFWLAPFSTYPTTQSSGYSRTAKTLSAGVVQNRPGFNNGGGSFGLFGRRRRRRR